ncbi:hypothetical protein [Desulfohalovibrio reitneri]|uniref:hypothetical protein n=1 Tax=Desulfohalovibrio reitneri TaxID=1307759 RepID=UPI0004A78297|nr:hypothetical protein [Desulfohalovibrio reitneri]
MSPQTLVSLTFLALYYFGAQQGIAIAMLPWKMQRDRRWIGRLMGPDAATERREADRLGVPRAARINCLDTHAEMTIYGMPLNEELRRLRCACT